MSLELKNNKNHISQSQDTLQQLQLITQNLGAIINLVGSVSGPATASLGDILERSAATLEELKTLSISVETETASVKENFCAIDSQLAQLNKLWAGIDKAVEFVAEKKQQLTELESLCTLVELITRKGKYERGEDEQTVPGATGSDDGDGSDSDAPVEISSKPGPDIILSASPEKELSLFEQVQERKREEEEKRQNRAHSKRRRRIKKLQAGEFLVKAKKAEFKVLTLNKGLKKSLEPAVNFKEQLLMARTSGRRERVPNAAAMRAKWI